MMTQFTSRFRPFRLVAIATLAVVVLGCGGSQESTKVAELKDRENVIKALPQGVSLESPVVPDKMNGESAKTVEDVLRNLQAYVRDGALYDGGMGHEIRFESATADSGKQPPKKSKGGSPIRVIKLAR